MTQDVSFSRFTRKVILGFLSTILSVGVAFSAAAQQPKLSKAVRQFVDIDNPVVALLHVRVIDGTGAPARSDQTLVLSGGNITAVGNEDEVQIPEGALVIDLTGKSVIPGLVHMHEHLFYPNGEGMSNTAESFSRLYLWAGVTSIRTAGAMYMYTELKHKQLIDSGQKVGPLIDVTGPCPEGIGGFSGFYWLRDSAEAEKFVDFWADAGVTSFKAYKSITRSELAAGIKAAHARGLKFTADLCSVTFREAADQRSS